MVVASLGGVSATLAVFQQPAYLPLLGVGAHTSRGPMETFRVNLDNVRVKLGAGPRGPRCRPFGQVTRRTRRATLPG